VTRNIRRFVGVVLAMCSAASMACNPPPGLTIQQWYRLCEADIAALYRAYGAGMDFRTFTSNTYEIYQMNTSSPAAAPGAAPMGIYPTAACSIPGQTACYSGWMMTCNGRQWLTGSVRCN
jgi:hypothetical protein